jgi:ABC-type glycerol-3-phosphate transport system substrate-binding protein
VAETALAGILQPLNQFVDRDSLALDEYLPFTLREASWEGKLYGLPLDTDTRVLYYRTDLFDVVGLDSRHPPVNIDELESAVRRLTTTNGDSYLCLGVIPWQAEGNLYTWGLAFGGSFYDPVHQKITANHPQVEAALSWLQDFANKYGWGRIQHLIGQFGSGGRWPFLVDQVAMVVDGNWRLDTIRRFAPNLKFSIAPIPYPKNGGKMTTWSGGWAFVIPKGAKHPEEAWEFMKFAAGIRGQELFMSLGDHLPTLLSLLKSEYLVGDPYRKVFAGLLPYAQSRPVLPVSGFYWDELRRAINEVLPGTKTPAAVLAEVTARVQRELDEALRERR